MLVKSTRRDDVCNINKSKFDVVVVIYGRKIHHSTNRKLEFKVVNRFHNYPFLTMSLPFSVSISYLSVWHVRCVHFGVVVYCVGIIILLFFPTLSISRYVCIDCKEWFRACKILLLASHQITWHDWQEKRKENCWTKISH